MAIFKRRILRLILQGRKTQTRGTSKHEWKIGEAYGVRDEWFTRTQGHITITRKFKQRLGDISPKDV